MAGFYEGSDLSDKTFYGFRLNPDTGNLNIEVINDGSVVSLPQEHIIDKYDYKTWFWTRDTAQLEFTDNGHLLMRLL